MYEYDLYLPLQFNDGRPIAEGVLVEVRALLAKEFGGVTDFRHRNLGIWKAGGATYRDEMIILRTLCNDQERAQKIFSQLKADLKRRLEQEEILIVKRAVSVL